MKLTPSDIADFERLENVVEKGQKTFVEVGDALTEIRDRRLYRKDFNTFEAYCQDRWGWSKRRGNQLIEAAAVVHSLPEKMGTAVPNEAVARELKKLPVPVRKEVVKESKKSDGPLTALAVRKHLPVPAKPPEKTISIKPVPQNPKEPEAILDKTGWPISFELMPIWDRRDEVQEGLTLFSAWKSKLRKAQDEKDKLYANVNFSSALSHLEQFWADLKSALPFAVCPTCQGKTPDSCGLCKGCGFIPELKWNTVVPKETKEMRKKIQSK